MSALSFVALSLQTTHLDPATVSQAAYLKVVDGNITRRDAIHIIPPTISATSDTADSDSAVSWEEALSQLSMVIGKLPIVSYYRDADKEIFKAASRRSDIAPPEFQWLDCRALARQLLPDLSDYQLSTVLKALNLYDEHVDSGAVEQTAHIVQKLAEQHEVTTVRDLWGELYDQPDDPLGLEATLTALSSSSASPITDSPQSSSETVDLETDQSVDRTDLAHDSESEGSSAVDGSDATRLAEEPTEAAESVPEAAPSQEEEEQPPVPEISPEEPDTADAGSMEDSEAVASPSVTDSAESADSNDETLVDNETVDATETESTEATTEQFDDSTAESVIHSANLEQPEFLKIPETDEGDLEAPEPQVVSPDEDDNQNPATPVEHQQGETSTSDPDTAALEQTESQQDPESLEISETTQTTPDPSEVQAQDATEDFDVDDTSPVADESVDVDDVETEPTPSGGPSEPSRIDIQESSDRSVVPESSATQPFVIVDEQPEREGPHPSPSSTAGRFWSVLGIIFFSLVTIVGLGLTVMATLLFFTTNDLLLETKIAGVVLTGAITLLSLLMTTLSYRSFRRK